MRSYLSLAGIQAKAHRSQNRMTIFCIVLAVFLVTGVFSMVDMEMRNQAARAQIDHGNWHICISNVPEEEAEQVLQEADVETSAWYDVVNYDLEKGYELLGKPVVICGVDPAMEDIALNHQHAQGAFPATDGQIEVTQNLQQEFGLNVGSEVAIDTPAGSTTFVISGFLDNESELLQNDAAAVYMTRGAFARFCEENGEEQHPVFYVRFKQSWGIHDTIVALEEAHGWEPKANVSENSAVLGAIGMSSNGYIVGLYGVAAVLMLLVVLAGVLMISGSMNSTIAERTQYFGMLRCIGAGKRQVKRLVRREALNWCIVAIPLGLAAAIVGVWIIGAVLHYGIGGEWALFPVFEISVVGIVVGAAIGIVTVLLAANAPARRAARVSPIEAVSAGASSSASVRKPVRAGWGRSVRGDAGRSARGCAGGSACGDARSSACGDAGSSVCGSAGRNGKGSAGPRAFPGRIDIALGINHAFSSKKGMALMTGSFALSIVLFLSFSVAIDWIGHALDTTKPYSPDMSVYYDGYEGELPRELAEQIGDVEGIKYAYGRMHLNTDVVSEKDVDRVDLISYEQLQFGWAKRDFIRGDMDAVVNGSGVLTVFEKDNPLEVGDVLRINGHETRIAGMLSDSPFSADGTPIIICSEDTFVQLTGIEGYAVVDVQVARDAGDETVRAVRSLLGDGVRLSDVREDKQEANNTYLAFSILVYGFLGIIGMIAVVNIINSISLSVSARKRQYGVMRALGMEGRQVHRMIAAESLSYAVAGCVAGCVVGLPLNALFFKMIIGNYWGDAWSVPGAQLAIIVIVVLAAAALATLQPAKRVVEMEIA